MEQTATGITHAADRLLDAIERRAAPVCVGLDPVIERLPDVLRDHPGGDVGALAAFTSAVLDAVADHAPCVKMQSACFERYGPAGVAALEEAMAHAHQCGLEVVLDAKRGDIGISAAHYAAAAFGTGEIGAPARADWLTVNSYLGPDAIEPFLASGRGVFALVRTSNPGSDVIQALPLADGRRVAEAVAAMVGELGHGTVGRRGYSALGAVVAATKPQDTAALRTIMPEQVFLVPGFGAQGGTVDDVLPCFRSDGTGAIVTASSPPTATGPGPWPGQPGRWPKPSGAPWACAERAGALKAPGALPRVPDPVPAGTRLQGPGTDAQNPWESPWLKHPRTTVRRAHASARSGRPAPTALPPA
ncbi:MAG: orotidine-5'-phosphate decarboxylase [Planctomycetota bacterium]|jgi:orotidine-5'-phosphate decarboxylase